SAFAGFVVYHKETVMRPLEIEEKAQIETLGCDDLKIKHEGAQYWSFTNWKLANVKICSCPNPPPQCTGGGGH
ncbi:MAG: hypothetical protein HZC29_06225, partial [Thaumarchaeota archaeon]|nr:hypothetical protein [Nitrososphaerota archaeon]